jgi:PEP-CTERM motif
MKRRLKMNTQIKNQFVSFLAAVTILTFSWSIARGDDLTPPPYRGNPLSVNAQWNLVPGSTILNLTSWSSVDDTDPTTYLYPYFTPDPQIIPNGGIYQLQLPNWVDNMPLKDMRLQLAWGGTNQLPFNIFSQGLDGTNLINATIISVSPLITTSAGYYEYVDFQFIPNLDFERIGLQLPANNYLTQAVVDTVSTIPEPATMCLLGLGSLSLLKRRRA